MTDRIHQAALEERIVRAEQTTSLVQSMFSAIKEVRGSDSTFRLIERLCEKLTTNEQIDYFIVHTNKSHQSGEYVVGSLPFDESFSQGTQFECPPSMLHAEKSKSVILSPTPDLAELPNNYREKFSPDITIHVPISLNETVIGSFTCGLRSLIPNNELEEIFNDLSSCISAEIAAIEDRFVHLLHYRALDHTSVAISIINLELELIFVNDTAVKLWEYRAKSDVIGKHAGIFFKHDKTYRKMLITVNKEGHWDGKITALRTDKSEFKVFVKLDMVYDSKGNRSAIIGSMIETEEFHLLKSKLQRTEKKYKDIFSSVLNPMLISTADGQIQEINQATHAAFGYSESELSQMNLRDLAESNYDRAFSLGLREVDQTGKAFIRIQGKRKDQSAFHAEMFCSRIDLHNHHHIVSVIRDISENVRYQNEIETAARNFESLVRTVPLGIIRISNEEKILYVNPAAYSITELSKNDATTLAEWKSILFPDKDYRNSIDLFAGHSEDRSDKEPVDYQEITIIPPSGSEKTIRINSVIQDSGDWLLTLEDITEAHKTKIELEKREAEFQSIFDLAPVGIGLVRGRTFLRANAALQNMTGYSYEELINSSTRMLYHDDKEFERVGKVLKDSGTVEARYQHKDGSSLNVLVSFTKIDPDSDDTEFIFTALNISDLRRMELSFERLSELSVDMFCICDFEGLYREINVAFEHVLGWNREDILKLKWCDLVHPDDRANTEAAFRYLKNGVPLFFFENRQKCKDGSFRWVSWNASALVDQGLIFATARDITEQKQTESRVQVQRELDRQLTGITDLEDALSLCLDASLELSNRDVGYVHMLDHDKQTAHLITSTGTTETIESELELLGNLNDLYLYLTSEEIKKNSISSLKIQHYNKELTQTVKSASLIPFGYEDEILGSLLLVSLKYSDIPAPTQSSLNLLSSSMGTTIARIRIEQARKESELKYRMIIENSMDGIFILQNDEFKFCNQRLAEILGYKLQSDLVGKSFSQFTSQKSIAEVKREIRLRYANQPQKSRFTFFAIHKDGYEFEAEAKASLIDYNGKPAILGVINDISKTKQLENELLQAQKMESIGRLAGGVAHDFNNLLTALSGNIELAMMDVSPEDNVYQELREISFIAERASELTRQLLAFSRKQIITPKVVNLNDIIEKMTILLKRLIGENIELKIKTGLNLNSVHVDPGQIEQVVVNLSLNARDAMPQGGLLTLATENIEFLPEDDLPAQDMVPGKFVKLSVSDNGEGIPAHLLERIFEPFFTTKSVNKGTGLGLASVYGIIKQSSGFILVDSIEKQGTTFSILFPAHLNSASPQQSSSPTNKHLQGKETILLVEDESSVRNLTVRVLTQFGYDVISCKSAIEALERAKMFTEPVDLLLSDIIMPKMNGFELVEKLTEKWGTFHYILMSGYSDDIVATQGKLLDQDIFLEKPFRPQVLLEKVRLILDK